MNFFIFKELVMKGNFFLMKNPGKTSTSLW